MVLDYIALWLQGVIDLRINLWEKNVFPQGEPLSDDIYDLRQRLLGMAKSELIKSAVFPPSTVYSSSNEGRACHRCDE